MSFLRPQLAEKVYLRSTQTNNSSSPVPMVFEERRDVPILGDDEPHRFRVAVAKFQIPTGGNLPVFMPRMKDLTLNDHETVYSFTMKYKTYAFTYTVRYTPEGLNTPAPSLPAKYDDPYFMVYNKHHVVDMLNESLSACWDALKVVVTNGGDTLPGTDTAPWMLYDPGSDQIIINTDIAAFNRTLVNPVTLWVNGYLHQLIPSFEWQKDRTATTQAEYMLDIHTNHNQTVYEVSTTLSVIQSYQAYSTSSLWSPVKNLLFTTSSLPVRGTLSGPVNTVDGAPPVSQQRDNIITDFSPTELTEQLTLSPNFYRWIDLHPSANDLKHIDVAVEWEDSIYGGRHQLQLPPGATASLLLVFDRV